MGNAVTTCGANWSGIDDVRHDLAAVDKHPAAVRGSDRDCKLASLLFTVSNTSVTSATGRSCMATSAGLSSGHTSSSMRRRSEVGSDSGGVRRASYWVSAAPVPFVASTCQPAGDVVR